MNQYIYAALVAMALFAGTTSYAKTPDGQTPAVETGCDSESGAAFGLCNAFCEAMDCDSDLPQASEQACERVLDRFYQITGSDIPPCNSLPQAGNECDNDGYFDFNSPTDNELVGCPDDGHQYDLYCSGGVVWICANAEGG